MIGINEHFPIFELTGVNEQNELVKINYKDYEKDWSVFLFYPKDFTFICPTEIFAMDSLVDKGYNTQNIYRAFCNCFRRGGRTT